MKKIVIVLSSVIIVVLSGAFVYRHHESWKPFRCNTHLSSHIVSKEGKTLELNLDISVVTAHKGSSELLAVGSLKDPDNSYVISRRLFMVIKQSDFKGYSKTMITREEHHPIDSLPDHLWQQYVLPEAPGIAFYMETKRLNDEAYFIKGLTNPHFVCVKTPD
ncbi:hypothetical protein FE224_18145 [Serratia marcescens]|uniref:hypothetical protein n=1 Tax=Serratia TaxID=613 RepID=UPI0011C73446|nr:hypothetical protein [Serratia marcescens]MCW6025772.1 hypothetical protein [Serratia marcescens]MDM8342747.1 hypothetical protein [Serratia marcescens]NVC33772.1 hypothetical protein [Serratia marcescens]NVC47406.1 hypothetical protein [Serratia marcescens]QLB27608.1 hypothetical protein FEF07_21145 [Serratia marcescens]